MILFFYGADSVRSRREMERTIEEFKRKRDPHGFNVAPFDCEAANPQEAVTALLTAPFLGEKKMVILKGIFCAHAAELRTWLANAIAEGLPEWLVLLVFESGDIKDKKDALCVALAKEKYAHEFTLATSTGKQATARAFEEQGVSVGADTLDAFMNSGIVDPWEREGAVRAIAAYVRGRRRTRVEVSDLALFVEEAPDDNTFHFIDALIARNAHGALTRIHGLWRAGANPHLVFGALLWQWRTLLTVAHYQKAHPQAPQSDLTRALNIKEFVARKALAATRTFSFETLRTHFDALVSIDKEVKRGGEFKLLLDRFIMQVCF